MSEYKAVVAWSHSRGDFLKGTYSREHTWTFDGGVVIPASPAPTSVPAPYSNAAHVDPEEAYVASISSCHMLVFLYLASKRGFEVASYTDEAVGVMTKNERGALWISAVVLKPRIIYRGGAPSPDQESQLHHAAHQECYIANSVKTTITVA
jgi:organic hydroperoxide reductase OsmC/OhrA